MNIVFSPGASVITFSIGFKLESKSPNLRKLFQKEALYVESIQHCHLVTHQCKPEWSHEIVGVFFPQEMLRVYKGFCVIFPQMDYIGVHASMCANAYKHICCTYKDMSMHKHIYTWDEFIIIIILFSTGQLHKLTLAPPLDQFVPLFLCLLALYVCRVIFLIKGLW